MAKTLNRQQLLEITSKFQTYFFRMVLADDSDDTAIVYGPGVNETVSIQECKSAADLHQVFVKSTLALSKQIDYELGCEVAIAFKGAEWRLTLGTLIPGSDGNVTRKLVPNWALGNYADDHEQAVLAGFPESKSEYASEFIALMRDNHLAGVLAEEYAVGVRPLMYGEEVYWQSTAPYLDGKVYYWTMSGAILLAALKLPANTPRRQIQLGSEFLANIASIDL